MTWVWYCQKCKRLVANRMVISDGTRHAHGRRCGGTVEQVLVI